MTESHDDQRHDDIVQLNELLNSKGAMGLEEVDGFFCALLVGLRMSIPNDYYPHVFGVDPSKASAAGGLEKVREILPMLLGHWNSIAAQLDAGEVYRPLIIIDASETALGKRWAKGFLRGVELHKESWSECLDDKDRAEAISPIFALAYEDDPDPKVRFDALRRESRMDLVSLASVGVKKINTYFRSRRVH